MLLTLIFHQPEMLATIIQKTPWWVWSLLAFLLWLGISQFMQHQASTVRVLAMPIAMAGLSAYGLLSGFGAFEAVGEVLATWLASVALFAAASLVLRPRPPYGTSYDAASHSFQLPGSGVPLVLILGIFFTKYLVNVELALQPDLVQNAELALSVAALYGVFNGVFAARAIRLWRMQARIGQTA